MLRYLHQLFYVTMGYINYFNKLNLNEELSIHYSNENKLDVDQLFATRTSYVSHEQGACHMNKLYTT